MFIWDTPQNRKWLKLRREGKSSDEIWYSYGIPHPDLHTGGNISKNNAIELAKEEVNTDWKQMVRSAGEFVALYGFNYDSLIKAIREGRIVGRKSSGIWLTTMVAIENAIEAGSFRSSKGIDNG